MSMALRAAAVDAGVMLAVKKVGVKNLVEALSDGVDDLGAMPTDYDLYTH